MRELRGYSDLASARSENAVPLLQLRGESPSDCPRCGSDYLNFIGTGSETVEDELHRDFPDARIGRMDRDRASGKRIRTAFCMGFATAISIFSSERR